MNQSLEPGQVCFTKHPVQEVASPPEQVPGYHPWALDLNAGFQVVVIEGECWVVVRWIAWALPRPEDEI